MRKRRRSASFAVEALEQRLVLNAAAQFHRLLPAHLPHAGNHSLVPATVHRQAAGVATNALRKSQVSAEAAPLSSIVLRGRFNPTARTLVAFTDRFGHQTNAIPLQVTNNTVSVVVPVFVHPKTGTFGPGVMSVSVLQQAGRRFRRSPGIPRLLISDSPQTGVQTGRLTSVFLSGTEAAIDKAITNYTRIGEASAGKVDVTPLVSGLEALREDIDAQRQLIQPIIRGQVAQIVVGTLNGRPIIINRSSLEFSDRVLGILLRTGGGIASPQPSPAIRTSSLHVASDDLLADLKNQITQYLTVQVPTSIVQSASRFRDTLTTMVGGTDNPAGQMVFAVTTLTTAFLTGFVEGGSKAVLFDRSNQLDDFAITGQFLKDSVTQLVGDAAINLLSRVSENGARFVEAVRQAEEVLGESDPSQPGSVANQVEDNLSAIDDNLPQSPPAGVTVFPADDVQTTNAGGSDTFDVVLDSQPTSQVTIGVMPSDASQGSVSQDSLVFDPSDWSVPQEVTVTGANNPSATTDTSFGVDLGPTQSSDPNYNGISVPPVQVSDVATATMPTPNPSPGPNPGPGPNPNPNPNPNPSPGQGEFTKYVFNLNRPEDGWFRAGIEGEIFTSLSNVMQAINTEIADNRQSGSDFEAFGYAQTASSPPDGPVPAGVHIVLVYTPPGRNSPPTP